jgi:hypothetical protein
MERIGCDLEESNILAKQGQEDWDCKGAEEAQRDWGMHIWAHSNKRC